ncbi:Hypothetical Protein U712_09195 [Bacillus subtilis PY79]|nr:Hypothetical Protein U712_09195 [Bacillus subtilis PY79]AKN13898.1 hypothetical protein ABU16_2822 [Bacillus subtilis]EME07224.1 hypothetical protein BS732_2549 [Bacillus subtilis MB73/2]KZD85678.1 hypothetical protein B4417_0275 [Bacillus subtilis]
MAAYQVSSLVNSPKNNSPELIESHLITVISLYISPSFN